MRELISNASDAIDRLRFEALERPELSETDPDYRILIEFDKDAGTLAVTDNGIGMSRQEVIENLGTIARSGTEEFFANLTGDQQQDSTLIGQFGVGFYSAFLVADSVSVRTKHNDDEQYVWSSSADGNYTIEKDTQNDIIHNNSLIKLYNALCPGPITFILNKKTKSN